MAGAPTFRRGDVIAKRYQVVTKSGETSLWVGYHGFDRNNLPSGEQRGGIPEPDVLIKIVRPELLSEPAARTHVARELQRVKGLQHPGMPRLFDLQPLEEHGTVVLIEPMQAGLSQGVLLRRMVTFRQNERFTLAEVRQISAQIASALSYVHGQMMCHGDLRLESVILRPDGAKLCDIGLGAALPRGPYLDAVKRANEMELLAPEVRAGKQPDPRSDVFGLASLYRYLISLGQQAAWDAFMAEKPAMGLVLMRGMADDPAHRYSSIEALIADVEAVALTGAPIRKRLAQTPLAMAVAAGRLPAEELNRPVEEIVSESARSRRNTGGFEVSAVLTPISGGPAAKMSIGTIPAALASSASTRSGRLVAAESGEFKAASSSSSSGKSGPLASSASATSASAASSSASASSSGRSSDVLLASTLSATNRITMPGRVRFQVADEGDKGAAAGPQAPATAAAATATNPSTTADATGAKGDEAVVKAPTTADVTTPYRSPSRSQERETKADAALTPRPAAMTPRPAATTPRPASSDTASGAKATAGDTGPAATTATAAAEAPASPNTPRPRVAPSARSDEPASGSTRSPSKSDSSRSNRSDDKGDTSTPRMSESSKPPRVSRHSPAPSEGSGRPDRPSGSQVSVPTLPRGMVVASRGALLGALVLAAVVGALVAVIVTLLLRPFVAPQPASPAAAPTPIPLAPPPSQPPSAVPPATVPAYPLPNPQLPKVEPVHEVEPPPAPLTK